MHVRQIVTLYNNNFNNSWFDDDDNDQRSIYTVAKIALALSVGRKA